MNSLLALFVSLFLVARATWAADTLFDLSTCYTAEGATFSSVLFSLESPETSKEKSKKISVYDPHRKNSISFRVYSPQFKVRSPEHWVFIFAGIGSSADSAHGIKTARALRGAGIKNGLVIIPSVFREHFANSFSTKGIVGNIPKDAEDLSRAINQLKNKLKKNGHQIEKVSYLGFSLGALTAAHLSAYNHRNKTLLAPEKVILMNSPIDLLGSLRNIDSLNRNKVSLIDNAKVAYQYLNTLKAKPSLDNIDSLMCALREIGPQALSKVITDTLKLGLDRLFLQGQERTPTGALNGQKRNYVSRRENNRINNLRNHRKADSLSFEDYVEISVFPSSKSKTLDNLNQKVSITSLEEEIKSSERYYLIHTRDDFLQSHPRELETYSSFFHPDNIWISERGGHLGLLNTKSFAIKAREFLSL